jgi:hypothetical protein
MVQSKAKEFRMAILFLGPFIFQRNFIKEKISFLSSNSIKHLLVGPDFYHYSLLE